MAAAAIRSTSSYNGQFAVATASGRSKNGKITRMVTDVTYNAITTDFWANLTRSAARKTWRMFGTGGDAKVNRRRPTASRTVPVHPDQEDHGRCRMPERARTF